MNSSDKGKAILVPKEETLDLELEFELAPGPAYSRLLGNDVPSSSGSNVKSNLLNMGFSRALVDKVIEEKGEDNLELLVETLLSFEDLQKSNYRSPDSLDDLFDDKDESSPLQISSVQVKEEPDELNDGKKANLLQMNFSADEVEIAIDNIGESATINELMDFILASRISAELENNTDDITHGDEVKEETSDELYGIMEKTLRLLEIGYSENEISLAIENLGAGTPLGDLADAISGGYYEKKKVQCSSSRNSLHNDSGFFGTGSNGSVKLENEEFFSAASQSREFGRNSLGKRPKKECVNVPQFRARNIHPENRREKRPKHEFVNCLSYSPWVDEKVDSGMCDVSKHMGSENQKKVKPPPYFFYGNVVNLEHNSWAKISHYLYECKPEFVNSRFFSALDRREWYIHNLPTENRFRVMPEPLMTIQDAMPHTRKFWPSWDTRKQLTCINSATGGISQLCDRLGKMVADHNGLPSLEEQRQILHHCSSHNLVWVGRNKLGLLDLESLERILGYPSNHTRLVESGSFSRLASLQYCFQIETLAYHLSSLKSKYPGGLTLFSMFSGLGGAEIALHKLGIPLKGVVFVETCAIKREIFRNWWESTRQRGQLEQFDDIRKLTTNKLENLMKKFDGFDLVICHSPSSDLGSSDPSVDFSLFYEFVRIFQRVRDMMKKRE